MPQIKDFLNPNSMLTPGIAGGLTVTISMAIVTAFNLKFPWISLIVSFLFGLLVIIPLKERIVVRALYCILNALIIFSVSFGTGKTIDPQPTPPSIRLELNRSINPLQTAEKELKTAEKEEHTKALEKYNQRWSW